jgi:hypothetical protein
VRRPDAQTKGGDEEGCGNSYAHRGAPELWLWGGRCELVGPLFSPAPATE